MNYSIRFPSIAVCLLLTAALNFCCQGATPEIVNDAFISATSTNSSSESRGLYWTISCYLKVRKVGFTKLHSIKLTVPGFSQKMPVKAVIQNKPAPLVIVLLGISGRADSEFSQLWPSWYADAGYHVLFFDSTFRPSFVNISRHGVSGNVWAETERISWIVRAFLQLPEMSGRITKQGVVGISYGGVQALMLGKIATFFCSGVEQHSCIHSNCLTL